MSTEERYDVIIIGAGHNGTTTAAYLSKCGLSVCVLEERPECGGCQETVEPIAGVRIQPHAIANYGGSAPGWEQLEMWKYGFRMDWNPNVPTTMDRSMMGGAMTSDGLVPGTEKDMMGWAKLGGYIGDPPFFKDLMRATFWCPPHPPEVELTKDNIPYMQVYKQHLPEVWTEELLEMTMFDLMDEYMETESSKVSRAYIALVSGAHGHMEGVAIPAFCSAATVGPPAVAKPVAPRGNIHGYFHALMRCAIAHGAVFRTCCPVDEIIVEHGRAVGVRLRDDATWGEKKIWADKAVISATHIKQTFLDMVGPRHLDAAFRQRIADLSIKGGSLYMSHFLTREELRYHPKFTRGLPTGDGRFGGAFFPMESRQIYFDHVADTLGDQSNLTIPPSKAMYGMVGGGIYDRSHPQCTREGYYINGPLWMLVPTPEYQPEGLDAMADRAKWDEYMRVALSQVVENLDSDNLVQIFSDSPRDQELRNTGVLGGSWYGIRCDRDQWWNERPLPELSRFRTPIDGLYLSHQSSAHPGGLCLMAVGYNLMHILIEDGIAEPGDWWYASPWYIPQQDKISAIPQQRPVSAATR